MYEYRLKAWALKDFSRPGAETPPDPAFLFDRGQPVQLSANARSILARVRTEGDVYADEVSETSDLMFLTAPMSIGEIAYLPGSWMTAVNHLVSGDAAPVIFVVCKLGGGDTISADNGVILTVGDLVPGQVYDLQSAEDLQIAANDDAEISIGTRH